MTLALVADWLTTYGGAEHVIGTFHELWPEAPIMTTVAGQTGSILPPHADIRTNRVLGIAFKLLRRHQLLLPWMPRALECIDLTGYDIVFSSSHAVGKGILPPPGSIHICYCHTPMRYAWEMENEYLRDFRLHGFLRKRAKRLLKELRRWDLSTAKRVDHFIANSTETQSRIKRIYGRESVVIPPPVSARFFDPSTRPERSHGGDNRQWRSRRVTHHTSLLPRRRQDGSIQALRPPH